VIFHDFLPCPPDAAGWRVIPSKAASAVPQAVAPRLNTRPAESTVVDPKLPPLARIFDEDEEQLLRSQDKWNRPAADNPLQG